LAHFASNPKRDLSFYYSEARTYLAWGLWYRGYPEQALERLGNAVAAARQIGNAEFLAGALGHAARFHILRREAETALKLAEEAYALAVERGFPSWIGEGGMIRGWALIQLGRESEGLEQLRKGIETEIAVLDTVWYLGGWPAEAFGKAGKIDEALGYLEKTFKPGHESYVFESDLRRLRGEMLLRKDSSHEAEAEDCFKSAIEIARHQGVKSLELNSTASFARLLGQQGKRDEARAILTEIYDWFTEGFDTDDLKDAKLLLDQLSG
jgi:tetratricopeptide (TPR) repeat protein